MPKINKTLKELQNKLPAINEEEIKDVPVKVIKKLIIHLKSLDDKRVQGRTLHRMDEIIVMVILATMCNQDSWVDIASFCKDKIGFFKKFLKLANGIPSHDTFKRVFGIINSDSFSKIMVDFFVEKLNDLKKALNITVNDDDYKQIVVDGKELTGSGRNYSGTNKIRNTQILNVYDNTNEICIYSKVIDSKTNEIPVAKELLKEMNLKQTIVTFDSLHTQKETIEIIKERKGDYVGGLKGNQPDLMENMDLYFTQEVKKNILGSNDYYETVEKSHSQIETRKFYLSTDIEWYDKTHLWKGLKGVILYEKVIKKENEEKAEIRYYITSLTDVKLCSEAIRGHWSVENNLHWQLDYSFREDFQTTIDKNALVNLSIVKKFILAILNLSKSKFKGNSVRSIRNRLCHSSTMHLPTILSSLDENIIRTISDKKGK